MVKQLRKYLEKDLMEDDVMTDGMRRVSILNALDEMPKEGLYLAIEIRVRLEEIFDNGTHEELKKALEESESVLTDWGVPIDFSLDWMYRKH